MQIRSLDSICKKSNPMIQTEEENIHQFSDYQVSHADNQCHPREKSNRATVRYPTILINTAKKLWENASREIRDALQTNWIHEIQEEEN